MKYSLFVLLVLFFASCRKAQDLYGHVHFSGKVTDKFSGQPLSNIKVQLVPYHSTCFSGICSEEPINYYGYISPVFSDTAGNYTIDFDASGQTSFGVVALPADRLYISSFQPNGFKLGSHNVDLKCFRSATLKVNIHNTAPYDTVDFIALTTTYDTWNVRHFYRDTTAYVIINGDPQYQTNFRFNYGTNGKDVSDEKNFTANPWDTVVLNYSY